MTTIDEIKARRATVRSWTTCPHNLYVFEADGSGIVAMQPDDDIADGDAPPQTIAVVRGIGNGRFDVNGTFIAHAPDDIAFLLAALAAANERADFARQSADKYFQETLELRRLLGGETHDASRVEDRS